MSDAFCTRKQHDASEEKTRMSPNWSEGKPGEVYGTSHVAFNDLKRDCPLATIEICKKTRNRSSMRSIPSVIVSLFTQSSFTELSIRQDVMAQAVKSGLLYATELADYLVRKGIPFREAHAIIGNLVSHCEEQHLDLADISLQELRAPFFAFLERCLTCIITRRSHSAKKSNWRNSQKTS